ncbi:hypothetical protein B0H14DRAFT_3166208 [Mycena olivaceomarginata]|nr:hypothetical protein B0H14DRAFT_3166208 [Mycena olivaceomarginata]
MPLIGNVRPASLAEVERKIQACEETLKLAKPTVRGTISRPELSASKIQTQLLETRSVTNWEEFVEYLSDLCCAKKVKEVRRSTLLAIESERQRQLSEGIKEVCEIHETVICSPAAARPTTRPATRRLGLAATRNIYILRNINSFCWGIGRVQIEPPVTTPKDDFNTWVVHCDHQESAQFGHKESKLSPFSSQAVHEQGGRYYRVTYVAALPVANTLSAEGWPIAQDQSR